MSGAYCLATIHMTYLVASSTEPALHVFQAVLAHPQPAIRYGSVFFRKRGVVPSVDIKLPEADFADAQPVGGEHCVGTGGGSRRCWRHGGAGGVWGDWCCMRT